MSLGVSGDGAFFTVLYHFLMQRFTTVTLSVPILGGFVLSCVLLMVPILLSAYQHISISLGGNHFG